MIKDCINKLNDKMVEIDLQQGDCLKLMHQIPDGGGRSCRYWPTLQGN